jgi:hypothetical protein
MSLIKMLKRMGPKIEPCGTPLYTVSKEGPILFNIFINDIFYSVDFSTIYNYADDNTLSYADHDLKNVISKLKSDSQKMLDQN